MTLQEAIDAKVDWTTPYGRTLSMDPEREPRFLIERTDLSRPREAHYTHWILFEKKVSFAHGDTAVYMPMWLEKGCLKGLKEQAETFGDTIHAVRAIDIRRELK